MKLFPLLIIGAGGFLGAITRYLIGLFIANRIGTNWPYGTFLINITGCFAIAFFLTLAAGRAPASAWASDSLRLFFATGFVGAYTTFSTYEWEAAQLVSEGGWQRALGYVMTSTMLGFVAVWLGVWSARRL